MKYKIIISKNVFPPQYLILYKKNLFTRWKYIRRSGLVTYWKTKEDAEKFINQEQIRLS
jgi:hypothetical protein